MNELENKLLVGVTGGIGSGKSEVCRKLEKKGFKVFYADPIAKELYIKNKELAEDVVKEFGKDILNFKGKINLAKLRKVIFQSKKNFKRINEIVHPVVIDYIMKEAIKCKENIILIEAALIFESLFDEQLDYIVMVFANKENRIKRIMQRDGARRADVENLMRYQIDERIKVKNADFVIKNNDTISKLNPQINFLSRVLKTLKKS
ncbi:MAG: dephospho-CoA kinase [Ignavibacteria bacterium]|nr:dephospho-CoA kinase [Ignavibacteria bacterium]